MAVDWEDPASIASAVVALGRECGCNAVSVDAARGYVSVECKNQQAIVNFWDGLAELASEDPYIADLALQLRRPGDSDETFAASVLSFVQNAVQWIREPGERFQLPRVTLRSGVGDCDCTAIVVTAILRAGGVNARCVAIQDGRGDLAHGVSQADLRRGWTWADASIPYPLGTNPLDVGRLPA